MLRRKSDAHAARFDLGSGVLSLALLACCASCTNAEPDFVAQNLIQCGDIESKLERKGYSPAVILSYETCELDLTQGQTPLNPQELAFAFSLAQPVVDCSATPNIIRVERNPPIMPDGSEAPPSKLIFCPDSQLCDAYRTVVVEDVADDICNLPKDTL